MRSQDWKQLVGKIIHGNTCHWLVMKRIINLQRTKVHVFSWTSLSRVSGTKRVYTCVWTLPSPNTKCVCLISGSPNPQRSSLRSHVHRTKNLTHKQARITRMLSCPELSCVTMDCFVWAHAWLDFIRDCPCGTKLVSGKNKCSECLLSTIVRTPNFSENKWSMATEVSQKFFGHQERRSSKLQSCVLVHHLSYTIHPHCSALFHTLCSSSSSSRCWYMVPTEQWDGPELDGASMKTQTCRESFNKRQNFNSARDKQRDCPPRSTREAEVMVLKTSRTTLW